MLVRAKDSYRLSAGLIPRTQSPVHGLQGHAMLTKLASMDLQVASAHHCLWLALTHKLSGQYHVILPTCMQEVDLDRELRAVVLESNRNLGTAAK